MINSLAKLNQYDINFIVELPEGEDRNEWIAYQLFQFHKQLFMLYRTLLDFCTHETCPTMKAGQRFTYLWLNDSKSPEEYPAPEYIKRTLEWVQEQLNDENLFPTAPDRDFPEDFIQTCEKIAKRLLRIFNHICLHHIIDVRNMREDAHMNTSLKHFICFTSKFDLISKSDLEPLQHYLQALRLLTTYSPSASSSETTQ